MADDTSDCEPVNGITPICGFQSQEDLEVMPGERLIIVSEYGGLGGEKPGALSSYNTETGAIERLYPKPAAAVASPPSERSMWGDEHCPGPPDTVFDPHGIHHNADVSAERLLVVNHGSRESVEIFEVHLDDTGNNGSLTWRGCVVAAPGTWLNDVVGLPNGGLAVSNMMPRDLTREQFLEIDATKADSGYVLEWHSASGWQRVPGTDGALPNGIEASADGEILFVNHYLGGKITAVERDTGTRLWTIELDGPDNSSWAPDGKLLVATHQDSSLAEVLECAAWEDVPVGHHVQGCVTDDGCYAILAGDIRLV